MNAQMPVELHLLLVALLQQYYRRGEILADARMMLPPNQFIPLLIHNGITETEADICIDLYDRWDDLLGMSVSA